MSSSEVFGHIRKTHEDLSKPALHHDDMAQIGWGVAEPTSPDGKSHEGSGQEMLETLTILDKEEAFLLPCDNALAYAYGDKMAIDFNGRLARTTIAKDGHGRKDSLGVIGSVKQSVSVPTTLQKVRRVLTGRGGKKEEEETTESYEVGQGGD